MPDIILEEVPPEWMDEFQKYRLRHLSEDEMISGEEIGWAEQEGTEWSRNRIRAVYFTREGIRIGAACYEVDREGECRIWDLWVFRPLRGQGAGHFCFEALEAHCRAEGATAFEVRCEKPAVIRFWKAFGFTEDGNAEGSQLRLRLS